MEHVRLEQRAHEEVRRVLKPSGVYLFTVPHFRDRTTIERVQIVDPADPSRDVDVLPREYHGDANSEDGRALAYRSFGIDLDGKLSRLGFDVAYTKRDVPGERDPEHRALLLPGAAAAGYLRPPGHQFQRPASRSSAGPITMRTATASIRTATESAKPSILIGRNVAEREPGEDDDHDRRGARDHGRRARQRPRRSRPTRRARRAAPRPRAPRGSPRSPSKGRRRCRRRAPG